MINLIYNDNAAQKHFLNIEASLRKRINDVMDDGILIEKVRYYAAGRNHDFLEYLLDGDNLKKLVKIRPERMDKAARVIKGRFPDLTDKSSKLYHIVYNIFISSIYGDTDRFDKLDFIKSIEVDTCPYCNR